MRPQPKTSYDSVVPSRTRREEPHVQTAGKVIKFDSQTSSTKLKTEVSTATVLPAAPAEKLKSGHAFSYAALFAFTLVLYARPSEFYPSPVTASIALVIGILT